MVRTQYYKILISGFTEHGVLNMRGTVDVTHYVTRDIIYNEKDGSVASLTFSLSGRDSDGFLWIDTLTAGMQVTFYGGNTVSDAKNYFTGDIIVAQPVFSENGKARVEITCFESEWKASGLKRNTATYPSPNCVKTWGRDKEIKATDILKNLVKDLGYKLKTFEIDTDLDYTMKSPIVQQDKTDYSFLQSIAKSIGNTLWFIRDNGKINVHTQPSAKQVNLVANKSFYFPLRHNEDFVIKETSDKMIQLIGVDVRLDMSTAGAGSKLVTKINPKTGEPMVATKQVDPKTGDSSYWVMDEAKLKSESQETRDKLYDLGSKGKLSWDDVKKYFTRSDELTDDPSRKPIPETYTVVDVAGDPTGSGHTATDDKVAENDGVNLSYSNMSFNVEALSKEPPEVRARLDRDYTQQTLSYADISKYFTVKKKEKAQANPKVNIPKKSVKTIGYDKQATKQQDGFRITGSSYGDVSIRTKLSYIIEGIAKYSDKYYLSELTCVWGSRGFMGSYTFIK